ncbi:MAG: ribonuclease P protein component [Gammaproteobacteria bacterium]|nr:ribonuclease P protein component [Gammaproteobacteria bacterium]
MVPARFPPRARLRSPVDFEAALKSGARLNERLFTAAVHPNACGHARLGLAISKKAAPKAVARNRIKRQVRESFRHRFAELPPLDIVIFARSGAAAAAKAEQRQVLERLWQRVAERHPGKPHG